MNSDFQSKSLRAGSIAGLLFAAVHAYRAFGGRVEVPDDVAPIAARP